MNNRQTFTLIISLLSSLAALSGCAMAQTKTISGPDGSPHELVSCVHIEACYQQASETCGGKYQIVNTSSRVSTLGKDTSSTTDLLVKCATTPKPTP